MWAKLAEGSTFDGPCNIYHPSGTIYEVTEDTVIVQGNETAPFVTGKV